MKIETKYDLINESEVAQVGTSLKNAIKYNLRTTTALCVLEVLTYPNSYTLEEFFKVIPINFTASYIGYIFNYILWKKSDKEDAIENLKELSMLLKSININTNYELLLKSKAYKTSYKIRLSKHFIPSLEQKKYIIVPVYHYGKENEISLVQEHVVGTKTYSYEQGEPTKVLKLKPVLT